VKLTPTAPDGGGVAGTGSGTSAGAGAGGGTGGDGAGTGDGTGGDGEGDGGTAAEQIAGEITSRDYPRDLFEAEVGGRVGIRFTVSPAGRVSECAVTRSSGTPVLDQLTCRLIRERFRYRPSRTRLKACIAGSRGADPGGQQQSSYFAIVGRRASQAFI
jgi:protein TonB